MADFHLTRRTFLQLQEIEKYSLKNWSTSQTARYMADIYNGFKKIAADPDQDAKRFHRSEPFLCSQPGCISLHFITALMNVLLLAPFLARYKRLSLRFPD